MGIALFLDETYYDRRIPLDKQPQRQSRILRVIGVEQYRSRNLRNTFIQALMRPVQVILKPTVLISTIYFLFTFAWIVGINTTLSIFVGPLYKFGPKQIGKRKFLSSLCHILILSDFHRILLFRTHHCSHPWGNSWPLGPRLPGQTLHPSKRRNYGARSPSSSSLSLYTLYARRSRPHRLLFPESVSLHDNCRCLGAICLWNHDHNSCCECLQP